MSAIQDLSGRWGLWLDPGDVGRRDPWAHNRTERTVLLPGSLDENGVGVPNEVFDSLAGLARKVKYVGPAWYFKDVELSDELVGRRLRLRLERAHWFSRLWVNGESIGVEDSLSVPHVYDLSSFCGQRSLRIALRIDNSPRIPIGRICHALTDWTQTNWNGVVGAIRLEDATADVLERVQVHTSQDSIIVCADALVDAEVRITLVGPTPDMSLGYAATAGERFEAILNVPGVRRWDCESPSLYTVRIEAGGQSIERRIGFRTLATDGRRITLNGEPIFLRGTLESCVFPKTGYPPTDEASWSLVMSRAKEFGLNHLRFHSWCPPEAAFVAADCAGVILQIELPLWTGVRSLTSDPALLDFCRREAHRILAEYGHHPSFALFALGNEMAFYGPEPEVDDLLHELKAAYPNRLYTFSSHGTHLSPACDYYVQADNGRPGAENRPLRGSTWFGVGSRFDREAPSTLNTCDEAASQFDRPVVSHEVGEWAVFPEVHNVARYDGVLEARNLDAIRRMLEERGMADQSRAFELASGKLSARLYKEEIETLLRTEGLAGYQLLGLTDFPGQGTATVGMLNALWEDKGIVTQQEFREHCSPTVPLLALGKMVWNDGERFEAEASVFHYGRSSEAEVLWRIVDRERAVVRQGTLGCHTLHSGTRTEVGKIAFPLDRMASPAWYSIELEAVGLGSNRWRFWLYADQLEQVEPGEVLIKSRYWNDVRECLQAGGAVWLRLDPAATWGGVPGRFAPAFWSPVHFKEQVGTMGALIEAEHPLFGAFPTETHSDWQWWDVVTSSKSLILDRLPKPYRPILQVIDRFDRNHKLGTIFEARVGTGRLLVTVIDFDRLVGRPAARQLEHSIRTYLASDRFAPRQCVSLDELDQVFDQEP